MHYELLLVAGVNTDLRMQEFLEIEKKNDLGLNDLGPKDESQLYIDKIKHCDRKTRFYTGLPNWATCCFNFWSQWPTE